MQNQLLRTDEFNLMHLVKVMLYTFISAIIAYLLGHSIEKIFDLENGISVKEKPQDGKHLFRNTSTLRLTLNTLLQCLLISVSVFAIHKCTSLFFYALGLKGIAYMETNGSRATFAASNVVIVMVFVHVIKTFNLRLVEVLRRLEKLV